MSKDYSVDLEKLFLEMMVANPESYLRVQNIYNPDNFDRSLKKSAEFIRDHVKNHTAMPTLDQIKATSGVELKAVEDLNDNHYDWLLEEFEGFTRRRELERAILQSADLLEKGDYDPVEKLIKDAVQISLTKDMGTDYFEDPRKRLEKIKSNNGQVSTGWETLDKKLFGGMNRGELNIFAGGSGSGKSLFMQNISINWILQGLNGVFLTLELSEELCAMRMDSMVANVSTREVFKQIDDVELKVKLVSKKAGSLRIKYMPAQSNVNQIRAYLKELEIKTGKKVDFIMVDYLDLVMPVSAKVSPNDLFIKDKYVSEELRNLAREMNILLVTASQLNRSAVDEPEFDHSHISGGISKINTADNVFGIHCTRSMRERGRYQLQLLKTRSSSGVGMRVDLDYDIDTLKITDAGEEAQGTPGELKPQADSILAQIKPKGGTNPSMTTDQPVGEVQSTKLKQMLAGLKRVE